MMIKTMMYGGPGLYSKKITDDYTKKEEEERGRLEMRDATDH